MGCLVEGVEGCALELAQGSSIMTVRRPSIATAMSAAEDRSPGVSRQRRNFETSLVIVVTVLGWLVCC